MKIKRKKLLKDLQDFAIQGNGVVIGSPGVGKTYLLKALYRSLESLEIPALILPIDQLGDGTDKTLREELSYEGDLIERLKSIPVSDKKAILLFDAFDAARNEQTRKRFLDLIRSAILELSESWNIIVTVRTYDAKKSQELLDLFGNPDAADLIQYKSTDILCRHFTIPSFDEDEILQAFDQIGCPKSIYNQGSRNFKDILANPFNLWLLEKILKASHEVPDFSQIHSEIQLLGLFWQRRVENENSERVLRRISRRMVKEHSLTVGMDDIYKDVDLDNPVRKSAWGKLQSDEILAKVSSTRQRIAFSHNILFDYAISVLLVEDEPRQFKRFVLEDSSRPLFLRPSLTYFFTRLWYYDSESFWKAFWHIFPSNQSVHLRLVARLIPASVIANEARKVNQLTPILRKLRNRETIANQTVMRLLQSLRMLAIERDALWSEFFDKISENLHADFAWDLATLTSDILERAVKTKNTTIVDACGRIGRRFLEWVWQERGATENDWYDRLGGRWAVPLVAKTYHTNMEKSRALLEKVLQLTKEENFPIDFLSQLTKHIDKIWDYDPKFVASVYSAIFTHYERSNKDTQSGGYIISFRISRRQEYELCEYNLIEHFPKFLQAAPPHAMQAAIQSLNCFIPDFYIYRDLIEENSHADLIETFNFRGKPAHFVQDQSHLWDTGESTDEPIKMADILFEFIDQLAVSEKSLPLLDSLLDVFCDEVQGAFFWKRLLKAGAQFPKVFAPRLFELCLAKPIQISPETSDELGQFLQVAAPEFTPDHLRRIEGSILTLPKERSNPLLAWIPVNLLRTDEAKQIREEIEVKKDIPESPRLISSHFSSEPHTEEERFQERGVYITTPENQGLHCFFKPLDEFSSNWRNEMPTAATIRLIFPQLEKAYATLKGDTKVDREGINLLWLKLTDCIAILSQVAEDPKSSLFTFCRQVLLEGAKHKQPKLNDDQSDSLAYSPYPRHEAASGLLRLAFHQPDPEILDAIEILASDPVRSVRMVTAMELSMVYVKAPDRFWHIMDNRASHEPNRVVQEYLYFTLNRVVAIKKENEAKTTHIMAKLLEHTPPTERLRPSDSFVPLLMWLAINRENSWALKTIEDIFFQDPIKFANLLARAASEVMRRYVTPKHLETVEGRERAKRAILWVSSVTTIASDEIAKLYSTSNEYWTEEETEKLRETYTIIETVIKCLYSAVGRKPDSPEKQTEEISSELRCEFYNAVGPLMQQIVKDSEKSIMLAKTAHYFMQVLTSFLNCNLKEVLDLAERVVKSSEPFGYNLDAIAVMDVVEFVEIVLADYRHEVRDDEECLEDLLNLLDMFAKTGWSDALKLVWRLDEVFR